MMEKNLMRMMMVTITVGENQMVQFAMVRMVAMMM